MLLFSPVAGSRNKFLQYAIELNRKAYGFEIKRNFHRDAMRLINEALKSKEDLKKYGKMN